MRAESNLKLIQELLNAMQQHDIEKATSFYVEDCVIRIMPLKHPVHGRAGLAASWGMAWTSFPDQYYEEVNIFADDNQVFFEGIMGGTQKGPYFNIPPTGKHIAWPVAFNWRIDQGKIYEWRAYWDAAECLRQMGIIPLSTELPFPKN